MRKLAVAAIVALMLTWPDEKESVSLSGHVYEGWEG